MEIFDPILSHSSFDRLLLLDYVVDDHYRIDFSQQSLTHSPLHLAKSIPEMFSQIVLGFEASRADEVAKENADNIESGFRALKDDVL